MCLLFLYVNPDPTEGHYKVILVNNRDEFYGRPTKPAHKWGNIYAGMDFQHQKEGGTWLGVSEGGQIGCLLNVLQPKGLHNFEAPSRGFLVLDYLRGGEAGAEYLEGVRQSEVDYNPFRLVTLEPSGRSFRASSYNSESKSRLELGPGVHGFDNSEAADLPFRKTSMCLERMREVVAQYGRVESQERLMEELFAMMGDTVQYFPDEQQSKQGKGLNEDFLRKISSVWVSCPSLGYGTRTTTAILVDYSDRVSYRERTMQEPIDLDSVKWVTNNFSFSIRRMD